MFHYSFCDQLKAKYAAFKKNRKQRQLLTKVVVSASTKKYQRIKKAQKLFVISSKNLKRNIGHRQNLVYERKKSSGGPSDESKKVVHNFFLYDDTSRSTAGKKETVTREKVKKQKRFLPEPLQKLYKSSVLVILLLKSNPEPSRSRNHFGL